MKYRDGGEGPRAENEEPGEAAGADGKVRQQERKEKDSGGTAFHTTPEKELVDIS